MQDNRHGIEDHHYGIDYTYSHTTTPNAGAIPPLNATRVPVIPEREGYIRSFNILTNTWYYKQNSISNERARFKNRIAARRYEMEMGGVDWTDAGGTTFRLPSDVDARTRLQTALDGCPEDGTIQYKLGGEFRAMTRTDLTALRDAIAAHVQACFAREAELFAAIEAAESVEALAGLEWNNSWPRNKEGAPL